MNQDRPAGPEGAAKEARSGTGQDPPEGGPGVSPERSSDASAEGTDTDGTVTEPGTPVQTVEIRRGGGLAVFALLVALAGLGGSAYLWWELRNAAQDDVTARLSAGQATLGDQVAALQTRATQLEKQVAEAASKAAAAASAAAATPAEALRKEIDANRGANDSLQSKLASLDDRIEGEIATLQDRIQSLAGQLATPVTPPAAPTEPSPDHAAEARAEALAWRRGELELLLRVAQRQADLAGDPADARQALTAADALIEEMDDPSLTPVRRAIAADLTALDALPEIDLDGLAFKLGSLQARVSSLPLREEAAEGATPTDGGEPPADGGLERLERKSMEFVNGLIRVRDSRPDDRVFQSPAEIWFLRRNLELELQSARVALLTANSAAYRDSLKKAAAWTNEYFDPQDPGVQAFLESLRELEARQVVVEVPELGSLAAYLDAARAATDG